jgi:Protein of unknown function (DUF4232)
MRRLDEVDGAKAFDDARAHPSPQEVPMRSRSGVRTMLAFGLLVTTMGVATSAVLVREAQAVSTPPVCHGAELAGTYVTSGAGLGNTSTVIAVTDVGTTACRLVGYPTLRGLHDGTWHHLAVHHGTYFGNLAPTTLQPRESGAFVLGTNAACAAINGPNQKRDDQVAAANTYVEVVATMPSRAATFRVAGIRIDVACGLDETAVGWRAHFQYLDG